VFCDSVEGIPKACEYLHQTGEFVHADRPDLILLNVGLPGPSDQDFLRIRQSTPDWWDIPVIAFSSPGSEADREACLAKGADVYAVKPADWEEWRVILSALIKVYSRRRL
jgi:DNA-binding response OmpR family regulator